MAHFSEPLMRDKDVAKALNVSVSTVWRRVRDNTLPRPIQIGRLSRWSISDVEDTIAEAKYARDSL